MTLSLDAVENFADLAVRAFRDSGPKGLTCLDQVPVAAYATDPNGLVIYHNPAAVPFVGRSPKIGEDRWCVTWKIFTDDDEFLPHEHCPMAEAIKTKQALRGLTAIAERPDGTRVAFMPVPSPVLDDSGNLIGAINLLVDITDERRQELEAKAKRARRLARSGLDTIVAARLDRATEEYEAAARRLRH